MKNKILITFILLSGFFTNKLNAQNVGISSIAITPDVSAGLE